MPLFSSESIPTLLKAGSMALVLTGLAFFSFAGIRERMPVREPVVLDPREIYKCSGNHPAPVQPRGTETTQGERPLRIASYNIHECKGMDLQTDPERVAAVIRSLDADIVSLQEVLISEDGNPNPSSQLRYLAEKTGMRMAVAGPTMLKEGVHYGNALMSRYPITNVRLHDISLGAFEPRGIIEADILVGNRTVRVIATHFGLWPSERNRQSQRLLQILPENPVDPLIVMGDMNGWVPGSPIMRRLRNRLGKPGTARSFPSPFPLLPLDRIWVLPHGLPFDVEATKSPLARVASDHLPMVISVFLRESNLSSK